MHCVFDVGGDPVSRGRDALQLGVAAESFGLRALQAGAGLLPRDVGDCKRSERFDKVSREESRRSEEVQETGSPQGPLRLFERNKRPAKGLEVSLCNSYLATCFQADLLE